MYDFKFGDRWISDSGIARAASAPDREIAQRDFELVEIPGRDGSDCIDNGRYKNVEFTREIGVVSKFGADAGAKVEILINRLAYLYGYQNFEESTREGFVTKAVLMNFPAVIHSLRTLRRAALDFSRLPYWYLKTALELSQIELSQSSGGTAYTGGVTVCNPLPAQAKPRFVFNCNYSGGTVRITLTVNGVNYLTGQVITCDSTHGIFEIDCEREQAFVRNADGEVLNFLNMNYPSLPPGESTISVTVGHIDSVFFAPRWRCL